MSNDYKLVYLTFWKPWFKFFYINGKKLYIALITLIIPPEFHLLFISFKYSIVYRYFNPCFIHYGRKLYLKITKSWEREHKTLKKWKKDIWFITENKISTTKLIKISFKREFNIQILVDELNKQLSYIYNQVEDKMEDAISNRKQRKRKN